MRTKLPAVFLIAAGFLGGALTYCVAEKFIDARHKGLPLMTRAGIKVGELSFDSGNCAVSLEPGVRVAVRRSIPGGAPAVSNPKYNPNWYVDKYGIAVELLQPLHTIPAIPAKQPAPNNSLHNH